VTIPRISATLDSSNLKLGQWFMPAKIKSTEITWSEPIRVRFGFSGLTSEHAIPIIRQIIQEEWSDIKRYNQCVYIIRLRGKVAVAYNSSYSPVIYIGECNAYNRLYGHVNWISSLLVSVPNAEIEIHIAQIARKHHELLYQYIEADMLRWFAEEFDTLPWFNRQREGSKESQYEYDNDAEQSLRKRLRIGAGNSFLWAIKPLQNNDHYEAYEKGGKVK
jgi:hypothetical protein